MEFVFKFEKPDNTCRQCRFKKMEDTQDSCSILDDKEILNIEESQDWCPLEMSQEECENLFYEATKKLGW